MPWPCACLPLLRQFNRKTFHAAGQCYGDASHGCSVVIIPTRIHFGPTGDDLDTVTGVTKLLFLWMQWGLLVVRCYLSTTAIQIMNAIVSVPARTEASAQ